jgi:hypothetical protein
VSKCETDDDLQQQRSVYFSLLLTAMLLLRYLRTDGRTEKKRTGRERKLKSSSRLKESISPLGRMKGLEVKLHVLFYLLYGKEWRASCRSRFTTLS